jgi:hypothetical protein
MLPCMFRTSRQKGWVGAYQNVIMQCLSTKMVCCIFNQWWFMLINSFSKCSQIFIYNPLNKTLTGLQMGLVHLIIHLIICFRIFPQISNQVPWSTAWGIHSLSLCWYQVHDGLPPAFSSLGSEWVVLVLGRHCTRDNEFWTAPAIQSDQISPGTSREIERPDMNGHYFTELLTNSVCTECLKCELKRE